MNVDIVRADDYAAIYVDGVLETWDNQEPYQMLIETLEGKPNQPLTLTLHELGLFGRMAAVWEDPPDQFSDIPSDWWTDAYYLEGDR